jgi:hypothetical protein
MKATKRRRTKPTKPTKARNKPRDVATAHKSSPSPLGGLVGSLRSEPPNPQRAEVAKLARAFATWAVGEPDQIVVAIRKSELAGQLRDMGVGGGTAILKSALKAVEEEQEDAANRHLVEEMAVRAAEEEAVRRSPQVQKVAKNILTAPDIVAEMLNVTTDLGHVGEDAGRALLLLSMVAGLTARTHEDAIHVIVKGPSSGGKNAAVKCILQLMPPATSLVLTNSTQLGLVYVGQSFPVLVFQEVEGVRGAEYIVRQIMSEGVVQRITAKGIVRTAFKTSVITTTTKANIHPENETRAFSTHVSSDPELTRKVLMAEAATAAGAKRPTMDGTLLFGWHEALFQLHGGKVVIPFANDLAKTFRTDQVRYRRDFNRMVNLIRACALLHQNSRKRDRDGHVIATEADRKMVAPVMAAVMGSPENDLGLTMKGEYILQLLNEMVAASRDGGWVDRTALVEAAELRKIANKNTVFDWCNTFAKEGVCEVRMRGRRLQYRPHPGGVR